MVERQKKDEEGTEIWEQISGGWVLETKKMDDMGDGVFYLLLLLVDFATHH